MKYRISAITIFLFSHFFAFTQINKDKAEIRLPEISEELISMRGEDQEYRKKLSKLVKKGKRNSKKFNENLEKIISIDRQNTARIREIVQQYGWPTFDLVGEQASNCAWLLVQHADRNPLVQMYCLPLLKEAVDQGQANPSNYAYLYDRVQIAKGEKQLYATQSTTNNGLSKGHFYPIADESNVQKRRDDMHVDLVGLANGSAKGQTIEAYAEALGFKYEVPTIEEAIQRDKAWEKAYLVNIKLAHQAIEVKDYSTAIDHYKKALECNGYTKTEDYVELARAISISKHDDMNSAFYYLIKAAIRGWDRINEFDTHEDFKNIKFAYPNNWIDLMNVVEELNGK